MTSPKSRKRRGAGDGGISPYQTKAGERFLIKYRVTVPDGISKRQILRRGYKTRIAAAKALREALAELDKGTHVAPNKLTLGPT